VLGSDARADPDPRPVRGAVPGLRHHAAQDEPNICTICERAFRRVKKRRHITKTVSLLFADMRGYTAASVAAFG